MTQKWVVVPWEIYDSAQQGGDQQGTPALNREAVLAAIPKNSRRDGLVILQHIERTPGISWNEKGELVLKGEVVPRTHISDLLKNAFYQYKNWEAEGAVPFYNALAESHLPESLIRNPNRQTLLKQHKDPKPPRYKDQKPPGIPAKTWLPWQ
jgi:hypothetical protein